MSGYGAEYYLARFDRRREEMRRQELARIQARVRSNGGVVLDVGCGLGELLELFPGERWTRYRIGVSDHALAEASSKGSSFDLPPGGSWCGPYAAPLRDHLRFLLRLAGMMRPFAFWRNTMECYACR